MVLSLVQLRLFDQERLRLIDQQIERTVSVLAGSSLSKTALLNMEKAEDIIFEALDDEPPNQVVCLLSNSGTQIYRNGVAESLNLQLPVTSGHDLITVSGHKIRYITYPLPGREVLLQVGLVLDQRNLSWENIREQLLIYSIFVIGIFVLLATFLTDYLLRPLKDLALYLQHYTGEEGGPPPLAVDSAEFMLLSETITVATKRWRDSIANYNIMMARLLHEVRTPLTILRNRLESIQTGKEGVEAREAIQELKHIENLTQDFMTWSKIEYSLPSDPNLFAISLQEFLPQLDCVRREGSKIALNFQLEAKSKIFAKPEHLRIVLENLISNARIHGDPEKQIVVVAESERVVVKNFGPAVPEHVLKNLGKPFNRASSEGPGTGLGLANVMSVCKKYGWDLIYSRSQGENVFTLQFGAAVASKGI